MQFEEKPDYNYLRHLFKNIMGKHSYETDFEYDWILKKEGNTAKIKEMVEKEAKPVEKETKPAGIPMRSQSKNLYDNREERKINTGHQIVMGDSQRMLPPKAGAHSNPFANAPQYKNGVNV